MHEAYPGTAALSATTSGLPPALGAELAEEAALHALYATTLTSVPRGVDFVSANENIHFRQCWPWAQASRTIHGTTH